MHKIFYSPLVASTSSYPIISTDEVHTIFFNIDQIYKQHQMFVENLNKRVDSWELNTSTLGDLFYEHDVNVLKLYNQYIDNFPFSSSYIDECMTSNLNFTAFIVQAEKDNKVKLPALLELPLKQLPKYYIELQELFNYTADSHSDHAKLKLIIARLKEQTAEIEHTQQQQLEGKGSVGKAGGMKRTNSQRARKVNSVNLGTGIPVLKKTGSSTFN